MSAFSDRYELGVPLGRNPAGIVWRARRTEDGKVVALAIADGEGLGDEALFDMVRLRFRKDLGALKNAKSPHLPTIHEIDEDDAGNPYAAMELIDGQSLATRLEDPIELRELGELVDGILRALEAAHRLRVVHGDLEPGNVLIRENGKPVVIGYGLNRALGGDRGAGSGMALSLAYRAPDADGAPTDARADLYSVGAILHRGVTGQLPLAGRSIATLAPALGASMTKVIDRALEPTAQGRYASAWAMRTALGAAIRMAQRGEKPAPSVAPAAPAPDPEVAPVVGVATRSSVELDELDAIDAIDAETREADSIPPPVVGVRTRSDAPPRLVREDTGPMALDETDLLSEPPPAPKTLPPPVPVQARSSSVPPAAPAVPAKRDDDSTELPLPPARSFVRSPIGVAAMTLLGVGVGWMLGRATAPQVAARADLDEVAEMATVAASAAAEAVPDEAPEQPEPEPETEPEVAAAPAEPAEPEPVPLRLVGLPDGTEALVDGRPIALDSPLTLPADGSPVQLDLRRGEQRVSLSLGADRGDAAAVRLNVIELPEEPEEPEPMVAAAPEPRPQPMAQPMARPTSRPTSRPSSRPTSRPTAQPSMRPSIARDPGF